MEADTICSIKLGAFTLSKWSDDFNLDDYTRQFVIAYRGADGNVIHVSFPFIWTSKNTCLQVLFAANTIKIRAYNGGAWSAYKSISLT